MHDTVCAEMFVYEAIYGDCVSIDDDCLSIDAVA